MPERRPGAGRLARLAAPGAWIVAGAMIALGQVPWGMAWLALAMLAVVFALPLPARMGAAALRGWALGFGHFLLALEWITQPFMVDPARDGWMAPFGLLFMTGGLALFWGAAFALASWGARRSRLPGPLVLVLCWAGAEMLRAHVMTGFPWAMIGHVWSATPLAATVALWGAQGLTLLTLALAAVMGAGLRAGWRQGARAAVLVLVPPAALLGAMPVLDPGPAPAPDPAAPRVRIVQPDVPQRDKTDPAAVPVYTRRLLDLTARPGRPDLVVWPETALPWLLDSMPDVLAMVAGAADGAPVALGVQREEGGRYFNALALVGAGGEVLSVYDKHHLVPFGEYVPLGDLMARWGIHGLAASEGGGYSAGPGPALIEVPGIGPAMPLICYEGIFAQEVGAAPGRARFLLLVTNDAWFGDLVGPYQHFALGRLRAIEQGLPMVRAANTGVSAMIDAQGRVIESLPLGQAGIIDAALPPALAPPLYARTGDWPVVAAILAGLAAALGMRRRIDPGGRPQ
ncbi:MAG: apolipoprotein N-acyltransferase [Rubellimicrobium sp.]|nr:apolipoprotein N-acyltransferase [Rubellimicrobium sp.]